MELHPIIDSFDTSPVTSGLWYVASCESNDSAPSARVGATCTYDRANKSFHVIGGADPDGAHADVCQLRVKGDFRWEGGKQGAFKARYEHAAFKAVSHPNLIFIFGGADVNGNSNSVQTFDVETRHWSTPEISGAAPSPRTYRVSESAAHGDRFYVFSGGDTGSQPVGDRQIHCFDASSMKWETISAKGTPPKPRHGHSVVVMANKIVIFGGMSGHTFYNDLATFDLETKEWATVKAPKSGWPSARAGHGSVVVDKSKMAVFGGMSGQGALDDLWVLDCGKWKWKSVRCSGPPPASRLDFAITAIDLNDFTTASVDQSTASIDQSTASIDQSTASIDQSTASIDQSTASIDQSTSSIDQSTASIDKSKATSYPLDENHLSTASNFDVDDSRRSEVETGNESTEASSGPGDPLESLSTSETERSIGDRLESLSTSETERSSTSNKSFATIMSAEHHSDVRFVTEEEGLYPEAETATTVATTTTTTAATTTTTTPQTSEIVEVDSSVSTSSSSSSMILIFGGMDTEGEIFDDCLIFRL